MAAVLVQLHNEAGVVPVHAEVLPWARAEPVQVRDQELQQGLPLRLLHVTQAAVHVGRGERITNTSVTLKVQPLCEKVK